MILIPSATARRAAATLAPSLLAPLIGALLALVPRAAIAQTATRTPPQRGTTAAFVIRHGSDTAAVERVTRTAARLRGTLFVRNGPRLTYDATLGPGALVPRIVLSAFGATAAPTAAPVSSATVTIARDTAIALVGSAVQRIATQPGAMPWVNPSFALIEQIVRRALALGGATATVPLLNLQGGQTTPATVSRAPDDSVVVSLVNLQLRLRVGPDGRLLGGVIPSQGVTVDRVDGPAAATLRIAAPNYDAPPGAPYRAIDVRVPTEGGFALAGTLTLPSDAHAPVPAVVTITGSGLQDRDESFPGVRGYRPFRAIADTLSRRGVAVLRLDDRGFGASGGNAANATTADFADDIRAALDFLRRRHDIDARRLFLLGHSEGATVAAMIAATDPALRGIVLLAPPSRPGRDLLRSQVEYAASLNRALAPAARDSLVAQRMRAIDSTALQQPWLRYFLGYDPAATARQVHVPVLILQGATDRQVTANQAGELAADFRAGGERDVTVHIFPGLDHLFLPDATGNPTRYGRLPIRQLPAAVRGTIVDWIVSHARS